MNYGCYGCSGYAGVPMAWSGFGAVAPILQSYLDLAKSLGFKDLKELEIAAGVFGNAHPGAREAGVFQLLKGLGKTVPQWLLVAIDEANKRMGFDIVAKWISENPPSTLQQRQQEVAAAHAAGSAGTESGDSGLPMSTIGIVAGILGLAAFAIYKKRQQMQGA